MKNRNVISILLFVLAIVLLLTLGLVNGDWLTGVLLGLACALVGYIFYRRGKRSAAA